MIILYNGKKLLENSTVQLPTGRSRSIHAAPTKFLGKYIAHNRLATKQAASFRLLRTISDALSEIDRCLIRGEYKSWILKHTLAPSVHYYLSIHDILEGTIQKLHSKVNNLTKKWPGLPRSSTQAVLYHPDVLDLPFFSHFRLRAKIDYLRATSTSNNPLLKELASCLSINLPDSCPPQCLNLLQAARTSISALPPSSNPNDRLKQVSKLVARDYQAPHWDNHLDSLTVQSKFKDIIALEPDCKVWNRILSGLPAGHLSFILKAGADCIPTPLNLRRWKFQTDPKCPLCSLPLPTSAHILNQCPTALNQGRYTWRMILC